MYPPTGYVNYGRGLVPGYVIGACRIPSGGVRGIWQKSCTEILAVVGNIEAVDPGTTALTQAICQGTSALAGTMCPGICELIGAMYPSLSSAEWGEVHKLCQCFRTRKPNAGER